MFKKIFAIAVIAASLSLNISAQENRKFDKELKASEKVCKEDTKCHKQDCKLDENFQPVRPGKPDPFKGIELTADQKAKLEKLKAKDAEERTKAKEKMEKERKAKMEKRDQEIQKILTPAQYAQFKANQEVMKEKVRDGRGKPKGVKPGNGNNKPGGKRHNKHDGKPSCKPVSANRGDSLPAPGL
ncbi:MAG: hypothetical protein NC402_06200 [Prevotella sp.]|nr:hypothetical protein [Prevotella sp.]MCM1075206.1 hypothetical protein [Ruminococcus sp.]